MPLALLIAAVACYYLGRKLNSGRPQTLIDPSSGEFVILRPMKHRLYFIPVEYWGPLLAILAIMVLLTKL